MSAQRLTPGAPDIEDAFWVSMNINGIRRMQHMPIAALAIIVITLSVLCTVGLVALVRRLQPERRAIQGTPDIEGFYITVLGALFAIFVAFMIFVVWTRFEAAITVVDQEADELLNLYRAARMLPPPERLRLEEICRDYAVAAAEHEWQAMTNGMPSREAAAVVQRLWDLTYSVTPSVAPDVVVRSNLVESVDKLTDLRRHRLLQSRTGLPGILYGVLIFGGILTIAFASLFSVDRFWPHALKACVLASLISFMLLTVWVLDHPFRGDVHVDSSAFDWTLEMMR